MPMSRDGAALRLKDDDHVAVCVRDVVSGTELIFDDGGAPVVVRAPISAGHKVALRAIAAGELIRKYGQTIGRAGMPIAPGEHVHVHNVEGTRGRGDLPLEPAAAAVHGAVA